MADFEGELAGSVNAGLQDGISKLVSGMQPSAVSVPGQAVLGASFAYNTVTLASAATISINTLQSNFFTYTAGGAGFYAITAAQQTIGQPLTILFAQGTSGVSAVMTFGSGFRTTGNLNTGTAAAGKEFIMQFISDGLTYTEASRTVAQ